MSVTTRKPTYHSNGHKKFGTFDVMDAFLLDQLKPSAQDPGTTAFDIEGALRVYVGSQPLTISSQAIELSGFAPSGSENYNKVLIALNGAGVFDVTSGTEAAAASGIVEPSFPSTSLPIAMVTLQNVSGTLQNFTSTEVEDIRPLVGGGVGSGSGGGGEEQRYIDTMQTMGWFELAVDKLGDSTNVDAGNTTMDDATSANSGYEWTVAGKIFQTNDLFRTGATAVKEVLVMVDTADTGLVVEVSANGTSTWNTVPVNKTFAIPTADQGSDLRLRMTSVAASGSVDSFGIMWDNRSALDSLGFPFREVKVFSSAPGSTVDTVTGKTGYVLEIPNSRKYVVDSGMLQVFKNGVLLGKDSTISAGWDDDNRLVELSSSSVLLKEQPSANVDEFTLLVSEGRISDQLSQNINKVNFAFDAMVSSKGDAAGTGGIYSSLNDALADAQDGWRIYLDDETFTISSTLTVTNSDLRIEAKSPGSILQASSSGVTNGFAISGADVNIEGITFKDFATAIDLNGNRAMVLKNRFTGNSTDVDTTGSTNEIIDQNISY